MKRFFIFVRDNWSDLVLLVCQVVLLILSILVLSTIDSLADFFACFSIMFAYYVNGYSLHDDTIPFVKRCITKHRGKKSAVQ